MLFPLPFTCLHEAYTPGVEDEHGNTTPGWLDPIVVACIWYSPNTAEASTEPATPPTGGDRVTVDLVLVLDVSVPVDHRDKFTVDGKRFDVIGLPKDFNHGPFGFSPDRVLVELKWVG